MALHRLYILQALYDGENYTKSSPIDTYEDFRVMCSAVPFKLLTDAKDVVTKDWKGEHGLEVYIPSSARIKDYDLEVTFLYCGEHEDMRDDIQGFLKFLYGLNDGAISARLAMYDEETRTGRKDIRLVNVKYNTWWDEPDLDDEAIAEFVCQFHVYDPVTDVSPVIYINTITDLTWT